MIFPIEMQLHSISMMLFIVVIIYQSIFVKHIDANSEPYTLDGVFIVEFSSRFKTLHNSDPHEAFYRKMPSKSIPITPRMNFSSSIFNGASFHTTDPEKISALANNPDIAAIWPVTVHPRPKFRVDSIVNPSDSQVSLGNVTNVPHVMTGIDKLHALGYDGRGIKIAIIDTGADYRHPALGGGFGPGYKIVAGYDLVGDSYNGQNSPIPDDDPMDCVGHGTHVAGIIGANSPSLKGAAPNASLVVLRIFGCEGDAADDVLISSVLRAYDFGVHIISMSLGETSGWGQHASASLLHRITAQGVVCVASAGNSGSQGLFYPSGPAGQPEVVSVGSINNLVKPEIIYKGAFRLNRSVSTAFEYLSDSSRLFADTPILPLYALSFNTSDPAQACTPLPSSTPSLANKIVLIRRGTCFSIDKLINAQAFGAKYVVIYSNERPPALPASTPQIGSCMVSAAQGAEWIDYLQKGINVTLDFSNPSYFIKETVDNITGGSMSDFSSWSPTYDLRPKPELSAPGGSILSTYLTNAGSFAVLSGTSMSAPLVSGVTALYKQAHGVNAEISPRQIQTMFATSTKPVRYNDQMNTYSLLAPVPQQGGGLIDALQAVRSTTFIRPYALALNDTAHFRKVFEIVISNNGPRTVTYKLSHKPAVTVYTLNNNSTLASTFPPESSLQTATVIIQRRRIIVPRNTTAVVKIAFTRPTGLVAARIPIYSGYIQIKSSNRDVFHVSYSGAATEMKRVVVTDFESGFPYISTRPELDAPALLTNNQTFRFPNQSVHLHWKLAMGSSIVRIDVLGNENNVMVAGRKIVGSIPGFPKRWNNRDSNEPGAIPIPHRVHSWNGTLSSNKTVPAGYYRLLYRALKIFGKPENKDHYETWTSPRFRIVY